MLGDHRLAAPQLLPVLNTAAGKGPCTSTASTKLLVAGGWCCCPPAPQGAAEPVQSRQKALLASGSLQSFPSKESSGYQEGKQRPHTMRSVSGRGSQEAHSKAQLLGSELPFQLQAGSSVPGHFCFPIQQVVDLEPSTLAQKT